MTRNSRSPQGWLVGNHWLLTRFAVAMFIVGSAADRLEAQQPRPVEIEDLYRADSATDQVPVADGRGVIYCRVRVDAEKRVVKQSLWRFDEGSEPRPLEPGEPEAIQPQLSPDGKWILFLSSRPFPDGTPAVAPVPPYSDPAMDLWLLPVAGGQAIPLSGRGKPYGRIVTDRFYARAAFSPDGKRLVFVADRGLDLRSDAERRNDVWEAREDQGEGYEGYGPMQIWVADLLEEPQEVAASKITRVTQDDFWYGDPQWSPDGTYLVVHANRTQDQESVRFSINQNYDLWRIRLPNGPLEQLTTGPGPEFSPRIAPDGRRLMCLSSPRRGPHMDVFNLLLVDLTSQPPQSRVLFDHHAFEGGSPPHASPASPLPNPLWSDTSRIVFPGTVGWQSPLQCVDVDTGPATVANPSPAAQRLPSIPRMANAEPRLRAIDEMMKWTSFDGLEIEGILTRPPASLAKPPYKLLLMPHGGPHSRATGGGGLNVQIFARHGFAVFQPNFRGSTGYGVRFLDANRNDFGGGDMRDILTGIEHLIEQGIVDRQRQFVYGVSYGGYMTSWLVGQTNQFRAAVAQNAVTDLHTMWHLSDLQSWTEWDMSGLPWEVAERMRERSPITYAHRVQTPTLILHSVNDRRCPVAMGKMYYRALREAGVETNLVLYPNEGHGIRQLPHQEDVIRRVLDWFAKYDKAGP
jgi:dipeptidyl aminopeptidase/acylaminoacyl peptidase